MNSLSTFYSLLVVWLCSAACTTEFSSAIQIYVTFSSKTFQWLFSCMASHNIISYLMPRTASYSIVLFRIASHLIIVSCSIAFHYRSVLHNISLSFRVVSHLIIVFYCFVLYRISSLCSIVSCCIASHHCVLLFLILLHRSNCSGIDTGNLCHRDSASVDSAEV
jgi:hypothetical protein